MARWPTQHSRHRPSIPQHNYADLGVFVIGNQVRDNGHASSAGERGGIRVQLGGAGLYRPVTLQVNEIRGNRGAGDGSAHNPEALMSGLRACRDSQSRNNTRAPASALSHTHTHTHAQHCR